MRIIKAATDKLLSNDVRKLDEEELQMKLESLQEAIREHQAAYSALLDAMSTAAEEDTEKEIESNATMEATYEDYVDKVARSLKLISLYQKYRLHLGAAESWMEHATVACTDFLAQGRKHEKELGDLSVKIEPYEEYPLFNPLVPKVKQTLTNIRANILKSGASDLTDKPPSTATPPSVSGRSSGPFKLKMHSFFGRIRDFQEFYDRFTDLIATHASGYSDADKCCLLAEAMENLAIKNIVEKYAQGPSGYDIAIKELKLRHGRASVVFPTYIRELVQPDSYDYFEERLLRALDRTQHLYNVMEKINGATLSQVAVTLMAMDFDDELSKEWIKCIGSSEDLPTIKDFVAFATPLTRNLPNKKPSPPVSAPAKSQGTFSKPQGKREEKKPSSRLTTCPLCKASYHHLSRCQTFLDYNPGQRFNYCETKQRMC